MQTNLSPDNRLTELGRQADEILRRCVHCGFCLASCPTYEVLGNELDSPRGRIYLIKEMLEGQTVTSTTQQHLDRCLTCRNCESACPSGVQYGQLLDIGRHMVDLQVERPRAERFKREGLRRLINSRWFGVAYRCAQSMYQWLPPGLQTKVLRSRHTTPAPRSTQHHPRQVLMLTGCVQPSMMPSIDAAMVRVLDRLGIGTMTAPGVTCCGAVNFHMDAQEAARAQMRNNIDAWWPLLNRGEVEAIVMNASGCGAMVHEYAYHLRLDPSYAEKARLISDKVVDIATLLAPMAEQLRPMMNPARLPDKPAFHPPCTLQHWQNLRPVTESLLKGLGVALQPFDESHLCCGSAGTYSILQSHIATQLRDRKLSNISKAQPDMIISANMGCICHLQSGTETPVRHWIEIIDHALQ